MNQKYKEILIYLIGITSGIVIGYLIFIPIFEDTFMGLFMGFLLGVGIWFSIRKTRKGK